MKKTILTAAVLSALLLTACSPQTDNVDDITVIEQTDAQITSQSDTEAAVQTEETSEASVIEEAVGDAVTIDESIINDLMANNRVCIDMFKTGLVEYSEEAADGEMLYKLINSSFGSFSDLEALVYDTYTRETGDMLLYNTPYEGQSIYKDYEGALCVDLAVLAPKGYFVDWNDCKVQIDSCTADRCEFTVTGQITEPGAEASEDYVKQGVCVLDNGEWLLENIIF